MERVIILVEDDLMIQKLLSRMIKRSGFDGRVEVFSDSESTFTFINETDDQVILALMDTAIHPEGEEALALKIKSLVPAIKLVASSGHSEEELRSSKYFGNAELDGVLAKPYGKQEVKDLLLTLGLL